MAASPVCSFSKYSKESCGLSTRYRHETEYVPLFTCRKDIFFHLRALKVSPSGIQAEWHLILLRAGIFHQNTESMTICPRHRELLGTHWNASRPVRKCSHPLHGKSRSKPERGISMNFSAAIKLHWGVLVPVGSGNSKTFIFHLSNCGLARSKLPIPQFRKRL